MERMDGISTTSVTFLPSCLVSRQDIQIFVESASVFEFIENKSAIVDNLFRVANKVDIEKKVEDLKRLVNNESLPLFLRDSLFDDPDIEEIVLLAYMQNKISSDQLATSYFVISAKEEEKTTGPIVESFDFFSLRPYFEKFFIGGEFARFIQEIQTLPPSERRFFEVPVDQAQLDVWRKDQEELHRKYENAKTPMERLSLQLEEKVLNSKEHIIIAFANYGWSFFYDLLSPNCHRVFSAGVVALLSQALKNNLEIEGTGCCPVYRLGLSPEESIASGYEKDQVTRDTGLNSRYARLPQDIDTFSATPLPSASHDALHLIMSNLTENRFTKVLSACGRFCEKELTKIENDGLRDFIKMIVSAFYNMDNGVFNLPALGRQTFNNYQKEISPLLRFVLFLNDFVRKFDVNEFDYCEYSYNKGVLKDEILVRLKELPFPYVVRSRTTTPNQIYFIELIKKILSEVVLQHLDELKEQNTLRTVLAWNATLDDCVAPHKSYHDYLLKEVVFPYLFQMAEPVVQSCDLLYDLFSQSANEVNEKAMRVLCHFDGIEFDRCKAYISDTSCIYTLISLMVIFLGGEAAYAIQRRLKAHYIVQFSIEFENKVKNRVLAKGLFDGAALCEQAKKNIMKIEMDEQKLNTAFASTLPKVTRSFLRSIEESGRVFIPVINQKVIELNEGEQALEIDVRFDFNASVYQSFLDEMNKGFSGVTYEKSNICFCLIQTTTKSTFHGFTIEQFLSPTTGNPSWRFYQSFNQIETLKGSMDRQGYEPKKPWEKGQEEFSEFAELLRLSICKTDLSMDQLVEIWQRWTGCNSEGFNTIVWNWYQYRDLQAISLMGLTFRYFMTSFDPSELPKNLSNLMGKA